VPIHLYDDFNEGLGFRTAIDFFNPTTGEYNIFKEDMRFVRPPVQPNLDIRSYVGLVADGKYAESLAKIRERLPFALSIGGSARTRARRPATAARWTNPFPSVLEAVRGRLGNAARGSGSRGGS